MFWKCFYCNVTLVVFLCCFVIFVCFWCFCKNNSRRRSNRSSTYIESPVRNSTQTYNSNTQITTNDESGSSSRRKQNVSESNIRDDVPHTIVWGPELQINEKFCEATHGFKVKGSKVKKSSKLKTKSRSSSTTSSSEEDQGNSGNETLDTLATKQITQPATIVKSAVEKIEEISQFNTEYWVRIDKLTDEEFKKEYPYYDEMFTRLLLKLDNVDVDPETRVQRRVVIVEVKNSLQKLYEKMKSIMPKCDEESLQESAPENNEVKLDMPDDDGKLYPSLDNNQQLISDNTINDKITGETGEHILVENITEIPKREPTIENMDKK